MIKIQSRAGVVPITRTQEPDQSAITALTAAVAETQQAVLQLVAATTERARQKILIADVERDKETGKMTRVVITVQ